MFTLDKQKKIGWLAVIMATLIFATVIVWGIIGSSADEAGFTSLNFSPYQNDLNKLKDLRASYENGLFQMSLFARLKSIFVLPLQVGGLGKENPFLLPLPPEDLLLKR